MALFGFLKKKNEEPDAEMGSDSTPAAGSGEKTDTLVNAGLSGAAAEVVQRYGSANTQFISGYDGVNRETGEVLSRSLKDISKYKVNADNEYNNKHQQAGFSAEVAKTSRDNAQNIIDKNNKRTVRSDDHPDYKPLDTVVDVVETMDGQVIPGTEAQMKFVGDPKLLIDHIATGEGGGKSDLSRYLGVKLDLPSDQVDDKAFKKYCEEQAERLRKKAAELEKAGNAKDAIRLQKQAQKFEDGKNVGLKKYCEIKAQDLRDEAAKLDKLGKHELAEKRRQQAKNYEEVGKNIRDSGISTKEALFYREHPELATARDIAVVSHRAGVEAAKSGAMISGGISLVRNVVAVVRGEKDPDEAALSVVVDTGKGTAVSYATGFAGSTVKSLMESAGKTIENEKGKIFIPNKTLNTLAKTNLPGIIVTATLEVSKTLAKYFKGEIDGEECLTELGEKGTGMLASALFAAVGQIAIPIPVLGGLIGGMVGYALNSACYNNLFTALKEAKIAREERIRIEAECEEAVKMIRQYRAELEQLVSMYLNDHILTFHTAFDDIKNALDIGDVDGFISGANAITQKLGGKTQFNSMSEFNDLMQSADALKL